jgi:hypothetical protein
LKAALAAVSEKLASNFQHAAEQHESRITKTAQ